MPTVEQIVTVLVCIVAAVAAVVVGYQIVRFIRAIGRVMTVLATIVAKVFRLALIGALAIGLVAGGIWWAIQPTASAAPTAPSTPRSTPTSTTSRAELPVMSPIEAQAHGEGFQFVSSYDNTVCTLHAVDYQEELVGYCE
jgi:hypothetical protein